MGTFRVKRTGLLLTSLVVEAKQASDLFDVLRAKYPREAAVS